MNSKEKKLQQLWRRKLAKSGFSDIENANGTLKNYDSYRLREMNATNAQLINRQRYYELARQFYWKHMFDTSVEKEVWRMHSEGATFDEIVASVRKVSRSVAHRWVSELSKVMLSQRVGKRGRG